jgi:hypothetical protein
MAAEGRSVGYADVSSWLQLASVGRVATAAVRVAKAVLAQELSQAALRDRVILRQA